MGLPIDPLTMFLALVASTAAAVVLLLWCFWLNRGERSLLWIAVGFLITSAAMLFMAGRGLVPDRISVAAGGGLVLLGISFVWAAARAFNARPVRVWVPVAGPAVWLIACASLEFYGSFEARMILGSVLAGACYLAAAREFLVRDGLLTRVAVSIALVLHGVFVLLRIPFVLMEAGTGVTSFADASWFGASTLESAIFIQVLSFLMVSLTKERVEARLRSAAHTDSLTGLGNRRAFFQWSEAAIARSARTGRPLAVVLFDLDRFKEVNDRHGHPIGDAVIQAFATAATRRLRAGDFVARLGGEEFAVTLPETTAAQASLVAAQIGHAFEAAVAAMDRPGLAGSASAGVAELSASARSLEELLAAADSALYEAKGLGGGHVSLATPLAEVHARAA
jgi:diguanylate cyclase (GGDEF)-like protein